MRLRVTWAGVLLLVAALEFLPSYSGFGAVVAFVLAVVVPIVLIRLAQSFGIGAPHAAALVIVLAGAASWWALQQDGDIAFTDAVPRLLTSAHPAPATLGLLAPAVLLTALVSTVVAVCVLAPAPSDTARIGGAVAPIVGSAVLYAAAQLLAGGTVDNHGIAALSIVLIAALGWSVPYRHGSAQAAVSWRPATVVPALAVVFLGLAAAAAVSVQQAFDPRTHVHPPVVHLDEQNPLELLAGWARNPDVEILRATVADTSRLRLAALADYSGASFDVDDTYAALGSPLVPDLPRGTTRADASASISITRLGGLWLPSPGDPTSVSEPDALVDPSSGTLARPEPVTPGLQYSVQATIDAPSADGLRTAGLAADVPARYTDVPRLPTGLAEYARDAIRSAITPLQKAVALENAVRTDRSLVADAPTGTSYQRLEAFLFGRNGTTGAQAGTSEQFAAAFCVLARAVGLPTRIMVGFVVGKPGADGASVVRGRDAEAWPEVYFAHAGWVPFAPTPGAPGASGDEGLRAGVLGDLAAHGGGTPPPVTATPRVAPPVQQQPPATHAAAQHSSTVRITVIVVAAVLAVVLLIAVLRVVRRLRHRRRGARGAWNEVLDLLVLLGRPAPRDRPAPEIASELDQSLGTPAAAVVAAAADREAFGPDRVRSANVWREVRILRRRARTQVNVVRRAGFAVDPHPLLRRR